LILHLVGFELEDSVLVFEIQVDVSTGVDCQGLKLAAALISDSANDNIGEKFSSVPPT
jgi:hypothetical protein